MDISKTTPAKGRTTKAALLKAEERATNAEKKYRGVEAVRKYTLCLAKVQVAQAHARGDIIQAKFEENQRALNIKNLAAELDSLSHAAILALDGDPVTQTIDLESGQLIAR